MKFLIVGAGISGAVIGRELAKQNHQITIIDQRAHLAGNCYTQRDAATGIMQHVYGPHIFHTSNERVWRYVNQHAEFVPYINRVKAVYQGQVYSLPINLHTINQFYRRNFNPAQAQAWISQQADASIDEAHSFEQQALKFVGKDLYQAFFKGYTTKQWGCSPAELPASILQRLPVRFNYDDNYFNHTYQAIPKDGYTAMVESILDHPHIVIKLNSKFSLEMCSDFDHVIWTGKLDQWFDYCDGHLGYRTLDFEKHQQEGDYQGTAVINYSDVEIPYTRISEHKHFAPWEEHPLTIYFKEYSRACAENDIPYYPIRLLHDKQRLKKYIERAQQAEKVTFVGRLATYRYMDMDLSIAEALHVVDQIGIDLEAKHKIQSFYHQDQI